MTLVADGRRSYRAGAGLELGPAFALNLEGEHDVTPPGQLGNASASTARCADSYACR